MRSSYLEENPRGRQSDGEKELDAGRCMGGCHSLVDKVLCTSMELAGLARSKHLKQTYRKFLPRKKPPSGKASR